MQQNSKTLEERQEILQREIAKYVGKGYQIQSSSQTFAVLSKKKKIRLITHLLIAALTFGVWLLVPLWQLINRKQNTLTISVDASGFVRES